ncbi:hypothetical protein EON66_08655 [archaeon]|nr:MAG: hypothetical protein EON66_08655 [archaeon]
MAWAAQLELVCVFVVLEAASGCVAACGAERTTDRAARGHTFQQPCAHVAGQLLCAHRRVDGERDMRATAWVRFMFTKAAPRAHSFVCRLCCVLLLDFSLHPRHPLHPAPSMASGGNEEDAAERSSAAPALQGIHGLSDESSPLEFVNRYAEVLDILFTCLKNHKLASSTKAVKYSVPLAGQPPGTGKTTLGENIPAVLRRPRESAEDEEMVATRLRSAAVWAMTAC